MKAGVSTSVIAHAALLIVAIIGLGATKSLEPPQVESIAVELVPIDDITQIRVGVEDSTVVETDAPAVVETETPAELAQPTGNTEENQITKAETETETPAPVVNTAPEPIPEPEPMPVVQPEPEPTPPPPTEPVVETPPEPEPIVPQPDPEVVAPAVTEEPKIAPVPAPHTAALKARADYKKKLEDEKKKKLEDDKRKKEEARKLAEAKQKQQDEAAREADMQSLIQNSEDSRGATTGAGGSQTLGATTGTSASLSQTQLDGLIAQIKGCFSLMPGSVEATDTVRLVFSLDAQGILRGDPVIANTPQTPSQQMLASAAYRAVKRCGPYLMAAGQDFGATFRADQLF